MHLDWTLNVGTLLSWVIFLAGGGKFFLMVRDALVELKALLREYPPHRHVNGIEIYPKGMAPGDQG